MARPKQETLTLFPEIVSITRKFSDAQFGALMRAVFAYRFGGGTYSGDDPAVDVAFQTVAGQIDRYIEICKGNSQNAKGREREQNEAECSETKQNPPPIHASLEMSVEELNSRRVAAFSTAPCTFGKLLFGKTTEAEDAAIINACGVLAERELHILAVPTLTVPQLEIQARNVHAQVVMVDYLGLLSTADRRASEYERVTQVSGDLKRMAKRMNCVVIALCQLNREATTASVDSRPKLSQLRSSGAIEQDADGVLLLHRPEYGQSETQRNPAEPQEFFIDVAKNRHGRTGTAELAWYAPVNRFVDNVGKWEVRSWA